MSLEDNDFLLEYENLMSFYRLNLFLFQTLNAFSNCKRLNTWFSFDILLHNRLNIGFVTLHLARLNLIDWTVEPRRLLREISFRKSWSCVCAISVCHLLFVIIYYVFPFKFQLNFWSIYHRKIIDMNLLINNDKIDNKVLICE